MVCLVHLMQITNFMKHEWFVYLLFEYFYQAKVLNINSIGIFGFEGQKYWNSDFQSHFRISKINRILLNFSSFINIIKREPQGSPTFIIDIFSYLTLTYKFVLLIYMIKTYFWARISASFAASDSFHDFFEASYNAFSFSNSVLKANLLRFENLIVWRIMLRCIKMVDSSFLILSSDWLSMTYNGAKLFNMLPIQMRETKNLNTFKTMTNDWLWKNIPSY